MFSLNDIESVDRTRQSQRLEHTSSCTRQEQTMLIRSSWCSYTCPEQLVLLYSSKALILLLYVSGALLLMSKKCSYTCQEHCSSRANSAPIIIKSSKCAPIIVKSTAPHDQTVLLFSSRAVLLMSEHYFYTHSSAPFFVKSTAPH